MDEVTYLRVAIGYKRVGTTIGVHARIDHEVKLRVGSSYSDVHNIKHLLSDHAVPVQKRDNAVHSHMCSKGLFQNGTWMDLNTASVKQVYSIVFHACRFVLDCHYKKTVARHLSHKDILEQLNVPPPELMIMQSRLCLLRILNKVPTCFVPLLKIPHHNKTYWMHQVLRDLKWVTHFVCFIF